MFWKIGSEFLNFGCHGYADRCMEYRMRAETVQNCFKKVGIASEAQERAVRNAHEPFKCINSDDVIETDQGLLASKSLITDDDILTEFQT